MKFFSRWDAKFFSFGAEVNYFFSQNSCQMSWQTAAILPKYASVFVTPAVHSLIVKTPISGQGEE